jgi:hypothetical protein
MKNLKSFYVCLIAALIFLFSFGVKAQTLTNVTEVPNLIPTNGTFGSIFTAVETSGVLSATNYSFDPYGTYSPKSPQKWGGGFLITYDVNNYVGLAIGGDYLGQFSLISGNATLKLPINVGAYLPSSWTVFQNVYVTPFALVGIGTAEGGSSGSGVTTIDDVGVYLKFGHLWGGQFNAGGAYGSWQGAGAYSGVRYHIFAGWSHGI